MNMRLSLSAGVGATATIVAGVTAITLMAAGSVAAAPSLSPSGNAAFPERAYVLTLPKHVRLAGESVRVTENGEAVPGQRVRPLGAAQRAKLGVVLALDASGSMRGEPYRDAFEAAKAFAGERNERQPLGIVTFSNTFRVALPFSTDPVRIARALADPPEPAGGTHLYDAALKSIELLRRSRLPGGFVVVLSDGTDRGSTAGAAEVIAAARAAKTRVYTVGLRSERFTAAALEELASAAGGHYSEASSPAELSEIYAELGAELSNSHLVTYRSLAAPRERVHVAADVRGIGIATASYTAPRLEPQGSGAAAEPGVWKSPFAVAAIACLVAGLLGLAVLLLLRRGRQSPRDRVAQFVGGTQPAVRRGSTLTARLVAGTERSLAGSGWWARIQHQLDVGGITREPTRLAVLVASGTLIMAFLVAASTGQALAGLIVLVLTPVALRTFVRSRVNRQRRMFGDQLADHLAVVGGAMRAGQSLPAAFAAVLDDAPEPARSEFERAVADERLGAPTEEALERVAQRMDSRDIEQVALLARLQREAGANAAEMLDRVVGTIRERQELRRTVRTLTAQGRMSRWVLSALPVAVLLFLTAFNRQYVDPLYSTGLGKLLLAIVAAMVIAGSLVIKRIVDFEL